METQGCIIVRKAGCLLRKAAGTKAQERGYVAAGRRAGREYKSPFGTQMSLSPNPDVGHGAKGLGVLPMRGFDLTLV